MKRLITLAVLVMAPLMLWLALAQGDPNRDPPKPKQLDKASGSSPTSVSRPELASDSPDVMAEPKPLGTADHQPDPSAAALRFEAQPREPRPAELIIQLIGIPEGSEGPPRGWVSISAGNTPAAVHLGSFGPDPRADLLAIGRGQTFEGDRWSREVDGSRWNLVRVQVQDHGTLDRLVPPFAGEHIVEVDLGALAPGATVVVWRPDLSSTVPGVQVRLLDRKSAAGPDAEPLAIQRTGADGSAEFSGLRAGTYLAMVDEAPPTGMVEQPVSFQVGLVPGVDHPVVHLIQPPELHRVSMVVAADRSLTQSPSPVLAARRLDAPMGCVMPLIHQIQVGTNEYQAELPTGHWEMISIPAGAMEIDSDHRHFAVGGDPAPSGGPLPIRLRKAETAEIRILVPQARSFPWRVHGIPSGRPAHLNPTIEHLGPRRWQRDTYPIALAERCRLGVITTRSCLISEAEVSPGQSGDVPVVPATLLDIAIPMVGAGLGQTGGQPIIEIEGGGMLQLVSPQPVLSRTGRTAVPLWRAQTIHSQGPLTLRCVWPDGTEIIKRAEASAMQLTVRIVEES